MTVEFIKTPHRAIFSAPTGIGKTHLVLDLIQKYYDGHFDKIIILCPSIRWNKTYLERPWVLKDENVWLLEPKDKLHNYIEKLSNLEAGDNVLFIVDDIIADESLDKRRPPLLKLSTFGRHKNHYLWILTQSYTAIPKGLRIQAKAIFVWYQKGLDDMKFIHKENYILTDDELVVVREILKQSKHACLYI